jgi:hypothetical protein
MDKDFTKAQTRVLQYWFVDGLAELAAGLVSIFLAVLFGVWQIIFTWRWSLLVVLGAGFVVSFGLRLIIQRIKEHTTYLRTGYAAPLSGLESKWSVLIAIAFTLLLLGLNYYLSTKGLQGLLWSPALAGSVFAFIFAWTGALTKLRRFYFLALLSLCAGVPLAVLGMDYFRGVGILTGVVGLILLYQGYRTRKAYIRQNPPPGKPIDE